MPMAWLEASAFYPMLYLWKQFSNLSPRASNSTASLLAASSSINLRGMVVQGLIGAITHDALHYYRLLYTTTNHLLAKTISDVGGRPFDSNSLEMGTFWGQN